VAVSTAASMFPAPGAYAQDAPAPASSAPCVPVAPPDTPPPPGLGAKERLTDEDYARKEVGGYVTGLPLFNYDPNTGYGFGGRLYYYYDGDREDPHFLYTPYLHRLIVQAFATTKGAQDHLLDYDAPTFLGSLYRVRATFEYEAASAWPYYGTGTRSLAPLSFPGAPGVTYGNASDYDAATQRLYANNQTYALYNLFSFKRPTLQLGLERLLLGGVLRPLVGLGFAYNSITDTTGQTTTAVDANGSQVQAVEAPTLLASDCAAGRIVGCGGGWDNVLRLALSLDTRDFEPDPNSGVYAELSSETALRPLGSQYQYERIMLSVRGFYSPVPRLADLVLAVRGLYEIQTSGTPFFSQVWLPFIDDNHEGLGGVRTLRGYRQDRFVGPIIALTNYEVRWTFTKFRALHQGFGLILVPFLDMGRVFDDVGQTSFAGWKRSQGMGFRVAWNEATIIMVDYGFSEEDSGLYINFNHIF
jgi:Omp85 superfamily domain